MQEGEDIALVESKPIEYHNTRALTAEQVKELKEFSLEKLNCTSGLSRHTIIKARDGGKVHRGTRQKLIQAVRTLKERTSNK